MTRDQDEQRDMISNSKKQTPNLFMILITNAFSLVLRDRMLLFLDILVGWKACLHFLMPSIVDGKLI